MPAATQCFTGASHQLGRATGCGGALGWGATGAGPAVEFGGGVDVGSVVGSVVGGAEATVGACGLADGDVVVLGLLLGLGDVRWPVGWQPT